MGYHLTLKEASRVMSRRLQERLRRIREIYISCLHVFKLDGSI